MLRRKPVMHDARLAVAKHLHAQRDGVTIGDIDHAVFHGVAPLTVLVAIMAHMVADGIATYDDKGKYRLSGKGVAFLAENVDERK
jgi:hypothetical protein